MTPTHLSDALPDLTHAVIALLRTANRSTVAWAGPPGEWRWIFERDGDTLRVRILWFKDTYSREPDERGELMWSTECRLADFAGRLKSQLDRLYADMGPEAYAAAWRRPF